MSSTNDTRSGRPRRKGILRGLDSDNIIQPTTTQRSVELGDEGSDEEGSSPIMDHRYATRTVESGRSSKIRDQYDMKYHPLDEYTRPKAAAKRRSGSRSVTAPAIDSTEETSDDESIPSTLVDSDGETLWEMEEEAEDDEPPLHRKPDEKATRRSQRSAAAEYHDYSSKHHPQDYGLPGHQHKATRAERMAFLGTQSKPAGPKKRKSVSVTEVEDDEVQVVERRPRKKLRTLDSSSSPAKKSGKKVHDRSSLARSSKKGASTARSTKYKVPRRRFSNSSMNTDELVESTLRHMPVRASTPAEHEDDAYFQNVASQEIGEDHASADEEDPAGNLRGPEGMQGEDRTVVDFGSSAVEQEVASAPPVYKFHHEVPASDDDDDLSDPVTESSDSMTPETWEEIFATLRESASSQGWERGEGQGWEQQASNLSAHVVDAPGTQMAAGEALDSDTPNEPDEGQQSHFEDELAVTDNMAGQMQRRSTNVNASSQSATKSNFDRSENWSPTPPSPKRRSGDVTLEDTGRSNGAADAPKDMPQDSNAAYLTPVSGFNDDGSRLQPRSASPEF